ncbi:MAG: hypothetical protein K0Q50_403 [Vampirovibrio sp.]|nr:hypothetical protein [Vampirovibrio sp.]
MDKTKFSMISDSVRFSLKLEERPVHLFSHENNRAFQNVGYPVVRMLTIFLKGLRINYQVIVTIAFKIALQCGPGIGRGAGISTGLGRGRRVHVVSGLHFGWQTLNRTGKAGTAAGNGCNGSIR